MAGKAAVKSHVAGMKALPALILRLNLFCGTGLAVLLDEGTCLKCTHDGPENDSRSIPL